MDDNLILANVSKAKQYSKGWHDNIEIYRNFYNGLHYTSRPKAGETQFVDPTPTNVVDLAVGIFLSNEVVWDSVSYRPEPDKINSDVEKLILSLIRQIEDDYEINFLYEIVLHFVRDGGAVLYTVFDDKLSNRDYYIHNEFLHPDGELKPALILNRIPLRVQIVDPMNVHVLGGGTNRWSVVARTERISLYQLMSLFGEEAVPPNLRRFTKNLEEALDTFGELVDYWDVLADGTYRHGILFEGHLVKPIEEIEERFFPYTIGFYKPTDRLISSSWHSILEPLLEPVRLLEKAINRRQFLIDKYSALPMVSKTVGGRAINIDARFGKHVALGVDEELGFPAWAGSPPDVERQIELLRARIQQAGFSDMFFGSGTSSASGYSLSLLGDQNRIRLEQPKRHLESFLRRWANRCLDVLSENLIGEGIGEGVFFELYGKSRGDRFFQYLPLSSLRGRRVFCEIRPEFPNDRVRNHALANQVRGIVSEETILERYIGIQQASDERERKMQEMAEQHPLMMEYGLLQALHQLAESGDVVAQVVLERMKAEGASVGNQEEVPSSASLGGMLNREMPTSAPNAGESPQEVQQKMANASPTLSGRIGRIA